MLIDDTHPETVDKGVTIQATHITSRMISRGIYADVWGQGVDERHFLTPVTRSVLPKIVTVARTIFHKVMEN